MLVGIILAAISWAPLARSRWSHIGCAVLDGCGGGVILGPVLVLIMWLFSVAVDGDRCLAMRS